MIILNLTQGTPAWDAARATHDCASEAAAMLGLAKNCKRSELLRMKHSGIKQDVSEWTQIFLFDKGHKAEELARPIVAKMLGEALPPVVGLSDDGKLLASLDGFTRFGDTIWENKSRNKDLLAFMLEHNDLPDTHWPQCEHQLLVSDADRVFFTLSEGNEDETDGIYYESKPDRRQMIIDGWKQFNIDRAEYIPTEVKEMPKADVTIDLPALFVHAKGEITTHNMDVFGTALAAKLAETRAIVLITDQDFSNAKEAAKKFRETAKAIALSKDQMLAQTETIGEAANKMDAWAADLNATALQLEKDVKREDLIKKDAMVLSGKDKYTEHVAALEAEIKPIRLIVQAPAFAEAIKGKSKYASMQDAVDTMLAGAKIKADAEANDVRTKMRWLKDNAAGRSALFPDLQQIIFKPMDDFHLIITSRIEKATADENARLEAERQKIRAEEQAKAQLEAQQQESARLVAERLAKQQAENEAKANDQPVVAVAHTGACVEEKPQSETQATLPVSNAAQAEVMQINPDGPKVSIPMTSSKADAKTLSNRMEITELLNSMNPYQVIDVLAYCHAIKSKARAA